MTWVSTVNLIVLSGATPVFVDVDRDTLMPSFEHIQDCVSERTRLIIPVHYEQDEQDAQLITRLRCLKFHGLGMDAYDRYTQGRTPQAEVLEPGYKYNMPDMLAALGLSQLSRIDAFNHKRAQLAQYYHERLSEIDEIMPLLIPATTTQHAWHLFIIRLDTDTAGLSRNVFMDALKARNIGTGIHFRPVHSHKYYWENMPVRPNALPNTDWNAGRICSLPLFPDMCLEDVDDVIEAIKAVLKK